MAHELGLRFLSPTVNLFFESPDAFLTYVEQIAYYRTAPLEEAGTGECAGRRYPIGLLRGAAGSDIRIHFLHYRTFVEAQVCWQRRSERIDLDRICVVVQAIRLDPTLVARFARLPQPRKVLLSYETSESPFVFTFRGLGQFVSGQLLRYDGLSGRRYLDEFDYPEFLRSGVIRAARN